MFNVFGFYKFKKLQSLKKKKYLLQKNLIKQNIRGTIILAKEGVNATIAGKYEDIKFIINKIKKILDIKIFDSDNISKCKFQPFHRGKVKIKKEIVPMKLSLSQKTKNKNTYIEPNKWNKLIISKDTLVLDSRKSFEYDVVTFKRSINPNVDNFKDFPKYLNKLNKKKTIAMFCTGGIRCEKASVYLKKKGFKKVYQLKGGILNYLNKVNKKKSLWKCECFVFDNRISVKHGLIKGTYLMCSGCRKPISAKDKKSSKYEDGVCCPNCHDRLTISQKERFRMRQKQISLAKKSGKKHIFQKEFN
jgi:UPF0176 protein